ncbi:MAG: hypothetical protein LQ351_003447 [Letrouitia transgressa]|nr:MAG: hypothetical protein LQ351_003447 [Letrouitia transgressa]
MYYEIIIDPPLREYFGNNGEPFTITVAGHTVYVLTQAKDVSDAYRNTTQLSFDEMVQIMMGRLGSSPQSIKAMFSPLSPDKAGFPNPKGRPLGRLARDLHMNQLYPGENLTILGQRFRESFEDQLNYEKIAAKAPYCTVDEKGLVVPLMTWTSDIFTRGGQVSYFGEKLGEIDPNLTWTFLEFDELSWQVLYQYPRIISRRMHAARDKMIEALEKYFSIPAAERGQEAWFTPAMEQEMRQVGINTHDIATMMNTIYWGQVNSSDKDPGINTNTRKACFWTLAYLLKQPDLLEDVRREFEGAFADGSLSVEYLSEHCPLFDGVWNETLRHSAYSASVRAITEDLIIGGKTLRKGNRLMVPYRQLHFNESSFGPDAREFSVRRFMDNPKLQSSAMWRPFGGGQTMCPGRYIAKRSVAIFVALALKRFDIGIVEGQSFPLGEEGKPVLGIMTMKGDMLVRIRRRELPV